MKITPRHLRRLIKEELSRALTEGRIPDLGPFDSEEEAEDSLERRIRTPMSALSGQGLSKDDFRYEKREDGFYVVHDDEGSVGDGKLSDSEARDLEGLVGDATADALSDGGDESSSSGLEKKADFFAKNIGKQVRGSGSPGGTIEGPPLMGSDGRYSVPISSLYGEPDYVSIENLEIINPQHSGETMREHVMKITRRQLRRLIKEELSAVLEVTDAYDRPAGGESSKEELQTGCLKRGGTWKNPGTPGYDVYRGKKGYCIEGEVGDGELSKPESEKLLALVGDATADALSDSGDESKLIDHWDPEGQEILDELEISVSQKSMDQVSARLKELWPKLSSDFQAEIIRMYASEYPVLTDLFKQSRSEFLQGHGIWG